MHQIIKNHKSGRRKEATSASSPLTTTPWCKLGSPTPLPPHKINVIKKIIIISQNELQFKSFKSLHTMKALWRSQHSRLLRAPQLWLNLTRETKVLPEVISHPLCTAGSSPPRPGILWCAGWRAGCTRGFLGGEPKGCYFGPWKVYIFLYTPIILLENSKSTTVWFVHTSLPPLVKMYTLPLHFVFWLLTTKLQGVGKFQVIMVHFSSPNEQTLRVPALAKAFGQQWKSERVHVHCFSNVSSSTFALTHWPLKSLPTKQSFP